MKVRGILGKPLWITGSHSVSRSRFAFAGRCGPVMTGRGDTSDRERDFGIEHGFAAREHHGLEPVHGGQ